MKWQGRRGSANIEDRRTRGRTAGVGGLGAVAVVVVALLLGVDPMTLFNSGLVGTDRIEGENLTEADQRAGEFVSVTLADTEEIWSAIFDADVGQAYRPATLVLYKGITQSSCGNASGATGPFYCPGDGKIYLDTAFFTTLSRELGAKGDFAAAYVVAHEVAHRVQDELGILGRANVARANLPEEEANAISVRIELQADCFAGVWARQAEDSLGTLEPGDVKEAIDAARRIGDDTLMANAGQIPVPEAFTHGTSEQRQRWFAAGYDRGRITACDTFGARKL